MKNENITKLLQGYIENKEIASAVLIVRKNGEIVYENSLGYANIEKSIPVTENTMYRLASMTKPLIAIGIMQLVEQEKIGLYDKVSKYIPEYSKMKVCTVNLGNEQYEADLNSPTGQKALKDQIDHMNYVDVDRDITVFDLLNHISGLGMGPVGCALADQLIGKNDTLLERARKYAALPLDFQPGTASGYSAMVGFEVLACLIELISAKPLEEYLQKKIFAPLEVKDISFALDEEQLNRVPRLYEYSDGILIDVTNSLKDWINMDPMKTMYHSGAAGLYGSVKDYEKIVHMLLNKGERNGVRILEQKTVEMMAGKNIPHTSVLFPGIYWGLGMSVVESPELSGKMVEPGTYGWSGAFGTHFFVDHKNNLEMVLGVNRSNIGGAASYVSFAVEKEVYESFASV